MQSTQAPAQHAHLLNRLIQWTLVSGLTLSMLLMTTGVVLYAMKPADGVATALPPRAILEGIGAGSPIAFMLLGILVLMVTPALRVAVAAVGYVLERDWLFALVSAGVMVVLLISLAVGAA